MQRKLNESKEGKELREEAILREKLIDPLNCQSLINLEYLMLSI